MSREQGVDDSHVWLLTVTGDVDATTVQPLDDAFDELVLHGARLLTLDLTAVSFLDSTGLRSIVRASNLLAERNGRLVVAGLSGAAPGGATRSSRNPTKPAGCDEHEAHVRREAQLSGSGTSSTRSSTPVRVTPTTASRVRPQATFRCGTLHVGCGRCHE